MNPKALLNAYQILMKNPNQILDSMNIPEQYRSNPNDVIQYLMNNGRITQEQYNIANSQARQLQNNPLFRQFFNK